MIVSALYKYKSGIRIDKISIINSRPEINWSGLCKRVYIEYFQWVYIICFYNDMLTIWTKMNIIGNLRHISYWTVVCILKSKVLIYWVDMDSTKYIPYNSFLYIWCHLNVTIRNCQIDSFTRICSKIVNLDPILVWWRFEICKNVLTIHENFWRLIKITNAVGYILIGQRSIKTNAKH